MGFVCPPLYAGTRSGRYIFSDHCRRRRGILRVSGDRTRSRAKPVVATIGGPAAVAGASKAEQEKGTLEAEWKVFSARMRDNGETATIEEWNELFQLCLERREDVSKTLWLLNMMRSMGRSPTAATYEKVMQLCMSFDDRSAAFYLVEQMWKDKVLLGDIDLPEGMEKTLRAILPPEAFD